MKLCKYCSCIVKSQSWIGKRSSQNHLTRQKQAVLMTWHYEAFTCRSSALSEWHQHKKRPTRSLATFSSTHSVAAVALNFLFLLFLTSSGGTVEKQHSRRLSKRRRGGPASGGKRCYSLWGGYVTSHLPLSLQNARIVFVNRAAMCMRSRGGSFGVAALAASPLR